MSLTSLGSLAVSAFDTARSTLKAISEAAVPPGDSGPAGEKPAGEKPAGKTAAGKTAAGKTAARKTAPADGGTDARMRSAAAKPEDKPRGRRGHVLDAYA
jgi:hypothetical protein